MVVWVHENQEITGYSKQVSGHTKFVISNNTHLMAVITNLCKTLFIRICI